MVTRKKLSISGNKTVLLPIIMALWLPGANRVFCKARFFFLLTREAVSNGNSYILREEEKEEEEEEEEDDE